MAPIVWLLATMPAVAAEPIDFNRQVRPLLAKHCYACHGADTAESDLRLDVPPEVEVAEDAGEVEDAPIVPGHPDHSEVLRRVRSDDEAERMPPEGKPLDEAAIAVLEQWITEGAQYEPHWSFQPLKPQQPPEVADASQVSNPIDAFVQHRLERAGLEPNGEADPRSLLRRLHYSTTGLPPSAERVERFAAAMADPSRSEMAYQRAVDRLLADPGFGERAARGWLDVVRYAESNSFERDRAKPNAWRYRDWVIDAFNKDKPYDRFVREQLAGDELPEVTAETLTATGYYRLGIWDDEPADPEQARFDEFDDLVSTTSQAFLGLTVGCARCHDHKIDPLLQKDYYAMVAFFRDVTPYATRSDEVTNSQIDLTDAATAAERTRLQEHIASLTKRAEELEQSAIVKMEAPDQRATEGSGRREVLREKLMKYLDAEHHDEYKQIREEIRDSNEHLEGLPTQAALGLARSLPEPPATHVLLRGSPKAPGDVVEPSFISLLNDPANQYAPPITKREKTAGRRAALADWIASPDNWFTARVMANRIWQHHFGRGIVRSSNNFGQLGEIPTHPELLDYLACELIRHDWNAKPLHRMILTSRAYRRSSFDAQSPLAADPRNDLFWRFDPRRLSAEELRDSMLAAGGRLNRQVHGPSMYPDVSDEVKAGQSVPGQGWEESAEADKTRRSIYIHIKRSLIPPELSVFDFPETDGSCEARFLTNQAAQSLNLLNSRFAGRSAAELADVSLTDAGAQQEFAPERSWADVGEAARSAAVESAVRRVYQRPATDRDASLAGRLIAGLQSEHSLDLRRAWEAYCLVLLNTNEFLYLD